MAKISRVIWNFKSKTFACSKLPFILNLRVVPGLLSHRPKKNCGHHQKCAYVYKRINFLRHLFYENHKMSSVVCFGNVTNLLKTQRIRLSYPYWFLSKGKWIINISHYILTFHLTTSSFLQKWLHTNYNDLFSVCKYLAIASHGPPW